MNWSLTSVDHGHAAALAAAGVGVWRWDQGLKILHLSATAASLLGVPESSDEPVIDYPGFLDRIHPRDRASVDHALHTAIAAGKPQKLDFRLAAGHMRHMHMRGRSTGPRVAHGILIEAFHRPQTDETSSRLAAIVTSSDDGIIAKTFDGIVTDWNPGAERIFGYTAVEMTGQSIARLLPPGQEGEETAILERLKRGERIGQFETARQRKDGIIIDVSFTMSPFHDASGNLLGASTIARDITQFVADRTRHQQTQRRLQDLQAELVQISRFTTLGEMASTLAHELNQPLAAIANYLNGARRLLAGMGRGDAIVMAREAMDRAAAQALRAGGIIRHLREFFPRGRTNLQTESLPGLIEEVATLARTGAPAHGIEVSFALDPLADSIFGARRQIQQVLLTLIRNALDALAETKAPHLIVATRKIDPRRTEISVADSGPGIAPDIAGRLFQPFVTSKPEGLGVGLSISRSIVEAHGGTLSAEPRPGGGTIFRVILPSAGKDG